MSAWFVVLNATQSDNSWNHESFMALIRVLREVQMMSVSQLAISTNQRSCCIGRAPCTSGFVSQTMRMGLLLRRCIC